jgi:hypothetical protein
MLNTENQTEGQPQVGSDALFAFESERFETKRHQWFVERGDVGGWVKCSPMLAFKAEARDYAAELAQKLGVSMARMRLVEVDSHVVHVTHQAEANKALSQPHEI